MMPLTRAGGKRRMSDAVNLAGWHGRDSSGRPQPRPIDHALPTLYRRALCGTSKAPQGAAATP
ncbi:hypothetical protein [Streptomyces sp. NBC_01443]|uniref:hypothetical protein n=1 Tax=Streptomyces sp. NBC_01443 TaxID=2903868 RepID=UPI00225BAC2C|nr:hypothetical protein [Streptomyces sp. NBC_01443]MCX4632045.1 hypothetical protein [Streptomyces sp. NBC_01443]